MMAQPDAMETTPSTRKVFRRVDHQLQISEEPIPALGSLDVLVKVRAVSLNWKDTAILDGRFPWPTLENGIPCAEFAGEIVQLGEKVRLSDVSLKIWSYCLDLTGLSGSSKVTE